MPLAYSLWLQLVLVMAGGAVGAGLRFLTGAALMRQLGAGVFPWATLLVNLAGAFAAGFLLLWLESRTGAALWRALLVVGLLGGLTTFSSLMVELLVLTRDQRSATAFVYLAASLAGGLLLVWMGARLAGHLR
jgi:CrcB protein